MSVNEYALVKRCMQCGTIMERKKNTCTQCGQLLTKEVQLDELPIDKYEDDET